MKNFLILTALLLSVSAFCQSPSILWYNKSADFFEESLVLGNGKTGASIFGGVQSDKIFLNDATLWSGEPVNPYMNPEAYKNLPAIREALKNEDYRLADQLQRKLQGKFSESYAPLGTLYIDFETQGNAQRYYRGLNIADAVSNVRYEMNGVNYTREYFISYPDQVMVIRLTSDKKGALEFSVRFGSLLRHNIKVSDNRLHATGYAPVAAKPNYLGDASDAVVFEEGRGTRFSSMIAINNSDGSIEMTDSTIRLSGATEAVIFVSLATSFAGFDKNPATEGVDQEAIAREQLDNAIKKPYELLKKSHLADYHQFFNRVSLNLGKTTAPDLATDERLKRYAEGMEDKNLEILYFQYGRYLLISSSRTPGVPANLQGIWNPYIRPPWSSNYTTQYQCRRKLLAG